MNKTLRKQRIFTRVCKSCHEIKTTDQFYLRSINGKQYPRYTCKQCDGKNTNLRRKLQPKTKIIKVAKPQQVSKELYPESRYKFYKPAPNNYYGI